MANFRAIHAVGESLRSFLRDSYPPALRTEYPCDFALLSSGQVDEVPDTGATQLSLYLYRVSVDPHLRNARRAPDSADAAPPLSLNLHFLMTVWTNSAAAEHTILGWAMRELHRRPTLDASTLSSVAEQGGWDPDVLLQVVPEELSNEDMMRIWDAFDVSYRLSVSYIARVVRIDLDPDVTTSVVARRIDLTDEPGGTP